MSLESLSSNYHGELVEVLLSDEKEVLFHSEFQTGVNLKVGEELIYISYPYFQVPPFGMMLSENVMDKLKPHFKKASLSISNQGLVIDDIVLSVKKSQRVLTRIDKKNSMSKVDLAIFTSFVKQSPIENTLLEGAFEEVISGLIGYGPGLTPSGDDFIVGFLAVDARVPFLSKKIISILEDGIKQKRTTDVSIAYLKAALVGEFSTAVVEVIHALGDETCLFKALNVLSKTGHSSGYDTIAGIYYALINRNI